MVVREDGRFVRGHHYSPATQFARGQAAHNRLPIGSVSARVETHTGLVRAWIKVAEPNVWVKRAVFVWECINGPLPRGLVVHHRDRDSMNDAPLNLEALTRSEHITEHRGEMK